MAIWLRSDKLCLLWNFKCHHPTFFLLREAQCTMCVFVMHVYMKDMGKTLQSLNELGSFITRE